LESDGIIRIILLADLEFAGQHLFQCCMKCQNSDMYAACTV